MRERCNGARPKVGVSFCQYIYVLYALPLNGCVVSCKQRMHGKLATWAGAPTFSLYILCIFDKFVRISISTRVNESKYVGERGKFAISFCDLAKNATSRAVYVISISVCFCILQFERNFCIKATLQSIFWYVREFYGSFHPASNGSQNILIEWKMTD